MSAATAGAIAGPVLYAAVTVTAACLAMAPPVSDLLYLLPASRALCWQHVVSISRHDTQRRLKPATCMASLRRHRSARQHLSPFSLLYASLSLTFHPAQAGVPFERKDPSSIHPYGDYPGFKTATTRDEGHGDASIIHPGIYAYISIRISLDGSSHAPASATRYAALWVLVGYRIRPGDFILP